jgi:hypothetical protein
MNRLKKIAWASVYRLLIVQTKVCLLAKKQAEVIRLQTD